MRSFIIVLMLGCAALAQNVSIDDLRARAAGGDYAGTLRQIDSQLFPSDTKSADRYELLMLKGECKLQVKDKLGSSSAFKSAAKAAESLEQFVAAQAQALIVDRSSAGKFTSKSGDSGPIDIMNIDSRKGAMIALQGDLWAQYKSQIDAAMRAQQLPQIEQVFMRVGEIYCLEMYAHGDARDTGKVMRELGGRAYELMQAEVTKCLRRVDYLQNLANSSSVTARGWDTGRMGLTSQQRDEVKAIIPYLGKIRDRATEYRRIAARLGGNESKWDALVADSVSGIADAESLYNDR